MIDVAATIEIAAHPEDILETVMDVDRYREADRKIRGVRRATRVGDTATVSIFTLLRFIPAVATQRMVLTPGTSIDVTNVAGWQDRLVSFQGRFDCRPGSRPGDTLVTHAYQFDFKGPLRPVLDRVLRGWLDRQIHQEVALLKALIEPSPPL